MSLRGIGIGVVFSAVSLGLAGSASGASLLTPYNVIVSGNFSDTNSDVAGGLAVGGIATLGTVSIADGLLGQPLGSFPSNSTFVAAGGASGSELAAGSYYFPGTDPTFFDNGGGPKDSSNPLNFTALFAGFNSQSIAWSTAPATAGDGCTTSGVVTTCTVTKAGMNVIDVTAAQIASGHTLDINGVSSADWLILNVAGTVDTLSGNMQINGHGNNGDSSPIAAEDVLFNFYQANTLILGGSSMGSVLAPGANVTGGGGQFVGSLVAASFAYSPTTLVGTEFHDFTFQGGANPEPAPMAFVGVGLIALALGLKRRRGLAPETGGGLDR